jgi:CheY-like chemotaxis protein
VLTVEGNATNRTVLDHYLNALGITSRIADDGPSALELLHVAVAKSEPFDLAILDIMLPGMDGPKLAQAIRQELKIGSPKLLLLTSVGKEEMENWLDAPALTLTSLSPFLLSALRMHSLADGRRF